MHCLMLMCNAIISVSLQKNHFSTKRFMIILYIKRLLMIAVHDTHDSYRSTPPYNHLVNMAIPLLRPILLAWRKAQSTLLTRPDLGGPLVVRQHPKTTFDLNIKRRYNLCIALLHILQNNPTVKAPIRRHPQEAEKVSATGAGHLWECVNRLKYREFVWARVQTGFCQGGRKSVHSESFYCTYLIPL